MTGSKFDPKYLSDGEAGRAPIHMRITQTRTPRYHVSDRLHAGRAARVSVDGIAATVSSWLAELGATSPLADDLARAARVGDWARVHELGDWLSVDVTRAA